MTINSQGIRILTEEEVEAWENRGRLRAMVRIKAILYQKNGYIVAKGRVEEIKSGKPFYIDKEYTISLVGHFDRPSIGKLYMFVGTLFSNSKNEKYDPAYDVYYLGSEISLETPQDKKNFLASILTNRQINNLYETLSDPFQAIRQEDIKSLTQVKGIGASTAYRIIDKYKDNIAQAGLLAFLEKHQIKIGSGILKKIISHYSTPEVALEKIKENPYQLVEVEGIGWTKADNIALSTGLSPKSIERYKAFLLYALNYQANQKGSTIWNCKDFLDAYAIKALGIENYKLETAKQAIVELIKEDKIFMNPQTLQDINWFGLKQDFYMETRIHKEIQRLLKAPLLLQKPLDFEEKIKEIEEGQGFIFNSEQRQAIDEIFNYNVLVITGKAGCGKTTVTNGFLNACEGIVPALCALSGKAAQRIGEVSKRKASTIHRLLSSNPTGIWADVVILDEASMVNIDMFYNLLSAIPDGTKLIIMGDIAQLEPIGRGNVLYDLIEFGAVPVCKLSKIHRQAADSGIISQSLQLSGGNKKIIPEWFTGTTSFGVKNDFIMDVYKKYPTPKGEVDRDYTGLTKAMQHWRKEFQAVGRDIKKITVVTPKTDASVLNAYELNQLIQQEYNPLTPELEADKYGQCIINKLITPKKKTEIEAEEIPVCFRKGDRVMAMKNDYQAIQVTGLNIDLLLSADTTFYSDYIKPYRGETAIYNGYLGTILAVNEYGMIIDFDFAGKIFVPSSKFGDIELGYASTVHKYQGSECHTVIFAMDRSANTLLTREMVYTGITRAKHKCIFITDIDGFYQAISANKTRTKHTFLEAIYDKRTSHILSIPDIGYEEIMKNRGDRFSLQRYKENHGEAKITLGKDGKDFIPFDDHFKDSEEENFSWVPW